MDKTTEKPDCCANGNYNPMQCRRGLCRCVDINGNQISKEVSFLDRALLESCSQGCDVYVEEEEEDIEEGDTIQDEL